MSVRTRWQAVMAAVKQRRRLSLFLVLTLILAAGGGYWWYSNNQNNGDGQTQAQATGKYPGKGKGQGEKGERGAGRASPIKAVTITQSDFSLTVNALGTVTAFNTAVVKPRVDGQLVKIHFREGQLVKAGEVLAEIDPRPFIISAEQAHGQVLKDQAQLSAAELDLARYKALLTKDSIAKQQVDAQEALVKQYQGTLVADKAQEANARLQLSFSKITAPASGRLGLRQVDVGNMVKASDANGLVSITQTQPIYVLFAIPSASAVQITQGFYQNEKFKVEAWDQEGKSRLAEGKLAALDNQIDSSTGTVKLKAEFKNSENRLFPNQFVQARLQTAVQANRLLVATAAIQRNAEGAFVYVIDTEKQTVDVRPVELGASNGEQTVILKGVEAGNQVVIDGADRLKAGAKVEVLSLDGKSVAKRERGDKNAKEATVNTGSAR